MPEPARLSERDEVEFKLSVVGEHPQATLDAVRRLERVGNQRLGPPIAHQIHDLYWDTDDRALGARGLTLRLRELDSALMFTAKGGGTADSGLFRRQELELPADASSWRRVRSTLEQAGIMLARGQTESPSPADWLAAAGLVVTQDRLTERVVRYVSDREGRTAELALDTTRYRFGEQTVEYREIEIEQLGSGPSPRALGEALIAQLPDQLEPASMGKYSRGLQLERELQDAVNRRGHRGTPRKFGK